MGRGVEVQSARERPEFTNGYKHCQVYSSTSLRLAIEFISLNSYITVIENSRGKTEFIIEPVNNNSIDPYTPPGAIMGARHRIRVKDPLREKSEYFYNGLVEYGWYVSPRDYVEYVDASTNNAAATVPNTVYYYDNTSKGAREEIKSIIYPEDRYVSYTYDYDNLNHITRVTYPDTKSVEHSYSGCCPRLIDSMTDRAGRTTFYDYDELERLIGIINPEGGRTRHEYDANSNWIKLIDPNKNVTTIEFNLENRLIRKTYEDGKFVSYAYDKNGLVNRHIDAREVRTNYIYDANRNLLIVS